jgi:hypothetical protein
MSTQVASAIQPQTDLYLQKFSEVLGDRIMIKELNFKGSYTLKNGNVTNDKCTLCRSSLSGPSPEDLQKGSFNDTVVIGKCEHCYHKLCIEAFLRKGNSSCPIDSTPWNVEKEYTFRNTLVSNTDKLPTNSTTSTSQSLEKSTTNTTTTNTVKDKEKKISIMSS